MRVAIATGLVIAAIVFAIWSTLANRPRFSPATRDDQRRRERASDAGICLANASLAGGIALSGPQWPWLWAVVALAVGGAAFFGWCWLTWWPQGRPAGAR